MSEFKARPNAAKAKALDTYSSEEVVNNDGFGEETKRDWLIVMGNVFGLVDESKSFQFFLTVLVNLVITVFIFSTKSIQKKQIGKQFFHKRIFLIFFQRVFC